ncbi:MAG: ABC transporter substrate-binding protein [Chloroflexi bacterium]|nr:ABC transporter substrate-binding protein [Chloroflexota bacterium]
MKKERNYWIDVLQKHLSRRQALRAAARAGLGMTGLALLGCAAAPAPTPTKAPSAAATPKAPAATPAPAVKAALEKVVFSYQEDPTSLDTHLDSGRAAVALHDLLYDGLYRWSQELKLVPMLAQSHRLIDDLTWEFKLRPGVKFHNGEDFTAEVIRFNVERHQDAAFKSRYISDYNDITKVEVVDRSTVRLVTKAPNPTVPLKFVQSMIAPMQYVKEKGNPALTTQPVGTGAYKFIKWAKDDFIELEANEAYWGWQKGGPFEKAGRIKKLTFRVIPDQSARIGALKTGAIDFFHNISADFYKSVQENPDLDLIENKAATQPFITISELKEGPLRDKRVRQALNYAVDVETIRKSLLGGVPDRIASFLGSAFELSYDPNLKPYPHDPKKAKDLMAAAGYPDGFEIVFDNAEAGHEKQKEVVQAVADNLGQVGIKAAIKPHARAEDFNATAKKAGNGPVGILYDTAGTSRIDPDFLLWDKIHSKAVRNFGYYSNPTADKLIEDARSTMDPEKRRKMYLELMRLLYDDPPCIFLWQGKYTFAYNKKKLPGLRTVLWMPAFYDYTV